MARRVLGRWGAPLGSQRVTRRDATGMGVLVSLLARGRALRGTCVAGRHPALPSDAKCNFQHLPMSNVALQLKAKPHRLGQA